MAASASVVSTETAGSGPLSETGPSHVGGAQILEVELDRRLLGGRRALGAVDGRLGAGRSR